MVGLIVLLELLVIVECLVGAEEIDIRPVDGWVWVDSLVWSACSTYKYYLGPPVTPGRLRQ